MLFNVESLNGKEVGKKKSSKKLRLFFKFGNGLKMSKSNNPCSLVIALNTNQNMNHEILLSHPLLWSIPLISKNQTFVHCVKREHKKELDSYAFVNGIMVIFHTIKNLRQLRVLNHEILSFIDKCNHSCTCQLSLEIMVCKEKKISHLTFFIGNCGFLKQSMRTIKSSFGTNHYRSLKQFYKLQNDHNTST